MTGLWQVSGRNRLPYAERLALDVAYVERLTLGRDLAVLSRALLAVLRGGGRQPCRQADALPRRAGRCRLSL